MTRLDDRSMASHANISGRNRRARSLMPRTRHTLSELPMTTDGFASSPETPTRTPNAPGRHSPDRDVQAHVVVIQIAHLGANRVQ